MKLKFTNVKYYRGGGTCPRRLRFNQNYTVYLHSEGLHLLELPDKTLIDRLFYITGGRVVPSSTTKVKKIK